MTFVKGKSGNPGGRKKLDEKFAKALRLAAPKALNYLIQVSQDPLAEHSDRIKAANIIIERLYGKAPQAVDMNMAGDLSIVVKLIKTTDSKAPE